MKIICAVLLGVTLCSTSVKTQSAPAQGLPTIFIIGDSTVKNGSGNGGGGLWGWGDFIAKYFDPAKIKIENRARGGRSSRTFITEGLWEQVLSEMKPGDFVLMQFGHNDGGAINDTSRARGSLKGVGEEIEEIDNLMTKKHEVVYTFGWYMRKYIADTKAKTAMPIVFSPIPRNIFKAGRVARAAHDYGKWAASAAQTEGAAFVDLNELIAQRYEAIGPEKVKAFYFLEDHTHTTMTGAELNAATVIEGIKATKDCQLCRFLLPAPNAEIKQAQRRYDFGSGKVAPGYTQVLPTAIYAKEIGYGFEPGTAFPASERSIKTEFITSEKPFYFSVALPAGNYKVTITFGAEQSETITTVKAELRRLMLEKVTTAKGKYEQRTFAVNLRNPQITGGGEVKLKDREKTMEWWAWDEKLTLEFNGARPSVCGIELTRTDNISTIFLLGDSTITDQPREPYSSWGQMLPVFFTSEIAIANHAESGESLKSSLGARRLDKVLSLMKPGDYLFIQYGHNDQKEKGEGVGAFTTYKSDLKKFIAETRQRGGLPILVTSMNRRNFDEAGKVFSTLGDYPEAVRQTAQEENVPLIDLHAMSKDFYQALGAENSRLAFKEGDGTHHNNYGSYELAKCIVEGIKANKLGLMKYLVKDLPAFDPHHPDAPESFKIPASPQTADAKPLGN